ASDMFATPLGHQLLAYPRALEHLTPAVPWFEMLVPIALFVPWATVIFRTAALLLLAGFHLTIGLLFETGLFQYAAVTGLLPFVPGVAWDRLGRVAALRGLGRPIAEPLPRPARRGDRPVSTTPRRLLDAGGQILVAGLFLYVVVWNVAGLGLE